MTPPRCLFALLCFSFLIGGFSLSAQEATPYWIWAGEDSKPKSKDEPAKSYLRHEFDVPVDLKRAILVAAADDQATLKVNNDRRGFSSGSWSQPMVETIGDQLKKGEQNAIAVTVENSGGIGAALILIVLEKFDGTREVISTNKSWMASSRAEKGWLEVGFVPKATKTDWAPATEQAAIGTGPRAGVTLEKMMDLTNFKAPTATAVEDLNIAEGFSVELLYSVPKAAQGSWVAMTHDDKGRVIVSDQYGKLYRFTPPAPGEVLSTEDVEPIQVDIGGAQGLHFTNDALYVVLNTNEHGGRGLYRITDSDGDDQFDQKELLQKFPESGGEHGPHAVMSNPDGGLTVVIGNQTPLPEEVTEGAVPQVWDEDLLLERPIGKGFMKGVPAPGGWIATCDLDGKNWKLVATGFRNEYDADYNRNGELFTYDADMEWDMNLPWYRPTRINHVTSGAEFGWRNGGGKWPEYYPDSLGSIVDIGPGSPTGVTFGYGAKFPKKYQDAFYAADWSYGKLYAVHMEASGGSYKAEAEEFISGQPFPLTDMIIHPDGAMYIAVGGRRVQSGLYRVTYSGSEPIGDEVVPELTEAAKLRQSLEAFHGKEDPAAVEVALAQLGHPDRYVRFAARIALEHQPVVQWRGQVLALTSPDAVITGAIALARHGSDQQEAILDVLGALNWEDLNTRQQIDLVRAHALAFTRFGEPSDTVRQATIARIDPHLPSQDARLDNELLDLLVYLQSPTAAEKGIALLKEAPSQEGQISLAKSLRHLKVGWTRELRADFYRWFTLAGGYKGGNSFGLFLGDMKKTALENTPEADQVALKEIIEAEPKTDAPQFTFEPRNFVKNWTMDDFNGVLSVGLEGNRDFKNGRKMFGAATCYACHRFNQEGGAIGPDLTSVAGKFSPTDLLESIIDPGKEISDQYGSMIFTMKDGSSIVGRIMNLAGDSYRVNVDMMDPNNIKGIDKKLIEEMTPSPVSMMPPGLINTLSQDDVLDLLAYLLSKGNADDPLFAH